MAVSHGPRCALGKPCPRIWELRYEFRRLAELRAAALSWWSRPARPAPWLGSVATTSASVRVAGSHRTAPASRAFSSAILRDATIPAERIDEAVAALRHDTEHEIRNVMLTVERMRQLGL
jgi:hypothetical protein